MLTVSQIADQSEIHKMAHSADVDERRNAVNKLHDNFEAFPDKKLAWDDIIQLVRDVDVCVQGSAAWALMSISHDVPDKEQAWQDLVRLTQDKDGYVRAISTSATGMVFHGISDKEQAWKNLHMRSLDDDPHVRGGAAIAIASAFSDLPNKEQAWNDLFRLAQDEYYARNCAGAAIMMGSSGTHDHLFSYIPDKKSAWKDIVWLLKYADMIVQNNLANAIYLIFPHIPDKELAWNDLIRLTQDEDSFFRLSASSALGHSFRYVPDKELAWKDLIRLTHDKDRNVRMVAAHTFSYLARYYREEKAYKKTSQCFNKAASAFRFGFREHIKPTPDFYLYGGLSSYYHGKAIVSELPNIQDPKKYIKNLQNAIGFFNKSINFIEKSSTIKYETERHCFPICLNIFSAYYEYNLSLLNLDEKRISKVQNYLKEASKHCDIGDTEKGMCIVKILEKLSQTLKYRINEIKIESKKQKAISRGKGKGMEARYETFLNNSRYDFEKHFAEINNLLNEIEAPLFIKITEIEKENLEKLKPEKEEKDLLPKSFKQRSYEIVKQIGKIVVAIGLILAFLSEIINNWDGVSEFIKNLLN